MTGIHKATEQDIAVLAHIGRVSFIQSHGHSAPAPVIEEYVSQKFSPGVIRDELKEPGNIYHILFYDKKPAGYSKIIFNKPVPEAIQPNITKLERLYLLNEFYGLQLGSALLQFNMELSRLHQQAGMWLYVWKENEQAIRFYKKAGFEMIGSHDFKITGTHYNPNWLMFRAY